MKKNTVILGGFANSGKAAMMDLLAEIDGYYYSRGGELRIITDPDGIMSLESALIDNWNVFQTDLAIKRFKRLINKLTNPNSYPYFRKDYRKIFTSEYRELSYQYLDKLKDFHYKGVWVGINDPIYKTVYKIKSILKKRVLKYNKNIYYSYPQDTFYKLTQQYLDLLIEHSTPSDKTDYIIGEGLASLNPAKVLRYFSSVKMIIVHRDPRDSYCNLINEYSNFFPKKIEHYIKLYKDMQINSQKNTQKENLLRINFEDLILKYDESKKKVFEFLNIDETQHIDKLKFFDPKVSIKNVGVWKKYKDQDKMYKIKSELSEYCYQKK